MAHGGKLSSAMVVTALWLPVTDGEPFIFITVNKLPQSRNMGF
jgi:hypothetical protein